MKKIELDHFCKLSYVSGLTASPNNDKLCFMRSAADLKENKYFSNIWLYEPGQPLKQLTSSGKDRKPVWLDDHTLLFASSRNSSADTIGSAYYTLNIHGGEAQKRFSTCHEISKCIPLNDEASLVALNYHPDLFELQQSQDEAGIKKYKEDTESYEIIDEVPFWSNGGSFNSKQRTALAIFNEKTLKAELLVDHLTNVESFELSPNGKKVLYIASSYKDVESLYNSLIIYDLDTKKKKEILCHEAFSFGFAYWLDDETILYTGKDGKRYGMNENALFYKADLNGDEKQLITPDFDGPMYSSMGGDAKYGSAGFSKPIRWNGKLTFITTAMNSSNLASIETDGTVSMLTDFDGAVMEFAQVGDHIIFAGLLNHSPIELYKMQDNEATPITDFNGEVNAEHPLFRPEPFTSISEDGTEIHGWMIKPADFNEARRYPAILNIHGGPKTVYGSVYYHEMQYWAQEGFVVLFCNPRGSDGRGNAFADIRGRYGTVDYKDLMTFLDTALERFSFIDPNRLGVTGGSYGGFMTNWIVGHTDRFKAAATQRSIANWVSMFGTTDIGYFFMPDQMAADPWTNIDKVWEQSPLKYADQIKTPLLVLHSEQDYRCWVTEGYQMFTALKYHGVPSRMVMFRGENHELSRSGKPKNRVKRLKEITDWMKLYLKAPNLE